MSKFKYLINFQLKKRFKSKAFLITNIIVFVLLLLITNLGHIIKAFDKGEANVTVSVYNETDDVEIISKLTELENSLSSESMGKIFFTEILEFDENNNDKQNVLVVIKESDILTAKIYNPSINITKRTQLQNFLTQLKYEYLLEGKLTTEEIKALQVPIELKFEEEDKGEIAKQILSLISMFLSIPIFILITFATQYVGGSIIEEKSTKAIEYLIANVSPKQHFFSKLLTSFVFLVVQMLLMVLYSVIGGIISTFFFGGGANAELGMTLSQGLGIPIGDVQEILRLLPLAIIFIILFAGLGGLLFMVIMAFLASISNSNEDYQTFQSPLMILMLGGFYGAIFGSMAGPNLFVKILGYIPFFSPFMAPGLYLAGIYHWYEIIISLVLLVATTFLAYKLIMPAYKTSILSYDTDKFFKRIKKAFKRKA